MSLVLLNCRKEHKGEESGWAEFGELSAARLISFLEQSQSGKTLEGAVVFCVRSLSGILRAGFY